MKKNTEIPHPRATRNRLAKATRLLAFLDTEDLFAGSVNAETLSELGTAGWAMIADAAGEDVPSVEMVAMLIGLVAGREVSTFEIDDDVIDVDRILGARSA